MTLKVTFQRKSALAQVPIDGIREALKYWNARESSEVFSRKFNILIANTAGPVEDHDRS